MNVLINGASGYLGKNFIKKYKKKYVFYKFSLLNNNINDIQYNNIDIVLHCAALVHQKIEHPYELYYEINVSYPLKLAKKAKKNGVKQFIFISTIAVYGEDKEKLYEDTNCNPVTLYGISKLEAEKQLLELNDDSFTISIIRSPMIYGNNAPGNIDSLIRLIRIVPILPFGKISNNRSFIFIENMCYMINEIIQQKQSGIFLASDDESLSTTKLCELITKNLDKKVPILKIPFFESLLKIIKPSFHKRLYESLEIDNTFTKEKLELKNPHSIEEGINLMIKGESK